MAENGRLSSMLWVSMIIISWAQILTISLAFSLDKLAAIREHGLKGDAFHLFVT